MRGYDYITVRAESVRGNEHLVDDALGMTLVRICAVNRARATFTQD
jgi:hypothetical protein